ncbi:receptor-like kinase TMK4 [Silene latifolia]|uniref:receptor-like kinase TMK4 n=1 Tax=Silene latifolia TaxID=37657 RepID=UPI003D772E17
MKKPAAVPPNFPFLLLLLLLLPVTTPTTADDKDVMSQLLTNLKPPPDTWDTATSYCIWKAVSCDNNNRVTSINLQSSSLTGKLPANLNTLTQLTSLSLENNHFSGQIPSFAGLTALTTLTLNSNNFTSVAPRAFFGLTALQNFSISDNAELVPWEFPAELVNSTSLATIYAAGASIVGQIPDIFDALPSLTDLRLSYNRLNGSLPASLTGSSVQYLWVNSQGLSGSIQVISGMNQLKQVWLHANQFTGHIPDLSDCIAVFDLQLRDNQLSGIVPPSLISLPNLLNVTLQNNKLQGPLPDFPLKVTVDVNNNKFCRNSTGDCDPQVSILLDCVSDFGYPLKLADDWGGNDACASWVGVVCDSNNKVITVNLAKQGFSGTISPAFANLTSLKELYLNGNNLTGIIPSSLTTLPQLEKVDVTHNNLTGKLPAFRSGIVVLTDGNPLFGTDPVVPGAGPGSKGNSSDGGSGEGKKGSSASAGLVVGVVIGVLVFVVVVMFVLYKCFMKKRLAKYRAQTREKAHQLSSFVHIATDFPMRMAYHALKMATNNFDIERKLGKGGFGTVFEGTLNDGARVAVKRLDHSRQGMKEFLAEVQTIGSIHHVNLVKLVGFCAEKAHRLLIYEHMSNGSLDKWIFNANSREELSWNTKKKIMLHIAKGLSYLHEGCQKRIAHLDVKPENVLLDKDFNAKLSDFGLAKLIDKDQSHVITQMRGTRGYLAPEWLGRQITEKVDVYSYGVVVLEIVFGRKNLDLSQPEESNLLMHKVKMNAEAGQWSDLLENGSDLMHHNAEELQKTIKLAIWCLHTEPSKRPSMSMVVKVFEGAMIPENSNDYNVKVQTRNGNLTLDGSTQLSCSDISLPR